jgi:hypothetical protein
LLGLYNSIIDLKAQNILRQNGKRYTSNDEYIYDLKKTFAQIMKADEKETYVEIPLNEIIGENLDIHIDQLPFQVLNSFGLECKSRFPDNKAIREILNIRFHFNVDEVKEMSPFNFG